jgi:hypothetical protein
MWPANTAKKPGQERDDCISSLLLLFVLLPSSRAICQYSSVKLELELGGCGSVVSLDSVGLLISWHFRTDRLRLFPLINSLFVHFNCQLGA